MHQYLPGKQSSLDINTSHCNWVIDFPDWEASGSLDWHWPSQRAQDPYELLTHFSDSSLYFPSKPLLRLQITRWCGSPQQQWVIKQKGATFLVNKKLSLCSQNKRIVILLRLSPTTYHPSVYFKSLSTISLDKKGQYLHCSLRRANLPLSSSPIDMKD